MGGIAGLGWGYMDRPANMAERYFDEIMSMASLSYSEAKNFLESLNAYAMFTPINTDTGWTDVPSPATSYYLGDLPVKPTLDDIPSPPVSFDYTEVPYVSTLLDALKNKLETDILIGSTGLDAGTEQEIYDRESERDKLQLSDTMDRIATRWGESGFTLPDGILTAMTSWADIEYQNKYSDKSRKIAEDSFKTAVENTRFSVEQAKGLESVLMQINAENNKNKIAAAQAILEAGIQIFDALVKEKLAKVDLYKAEAQAYEANANAVGAIAGVDIAFYKANTDYNVARSEIAVKQVELQIKQMEVQLTINVEIAKAISDVASRLAGGSMSAINAGVSIGYSGSESDSSSVQSSVSHSSSISDSTIDQHIFNES